MKMNGNSKTPPDHSPPKKLLTNGNFQKPRFQTKATTAINKIIIWGENVVKGR